MTCSTGTKSLIVDLKAARPQLVLSLIEQAQILVEGFRPGDRAPGPGPADCHAMNPSWSMAMTGWARTDAVGGCGPRLNHIA
jgi:alpha-methylacyl-CoA racemase